VGGGTNTNFNGTGGDGGRGGEFASGVTTHTVSDDEQTGAGIPRVLIAPAHESDIRARGVP
jgi:hypothetical protein